MRLMNISLLKPGQTLSYAIKTQDGKILLPANTTLTDKFILRLKSFNISSVYVEDDFFDEVTMRPSISDKTKTAALSAVALAYKMLESKKPAGFEPVKLAAKDIVKEIRLSLLENPIGMLNLYAVSDEKCLHAVNVAMIVSALAFEHGLNMMAVEDYTVAALMHDICLQNMKDDVNPGHAEDAKLFMKSMHEFNVRSYMSVAMHHERFDGTGPNKLKGHQIAEGSRMIAVADIYDNLVYGLGGYKKLALNYAVEQLNIMSGKALDPQFLAYFNSSVSIYPSGSTVLLNNGYKAVVTSQNFKMPARPKVRLSMPNRADCIEINLLTNLTTFIEQVY